MRLTCSNQSAAKRPAEPTSAQESSNGKKQRPEATLRPARTSAAARSANSASWGSSQESSVAKKQRPEATLRPARLFQSFRFLDLPAELRNAIYLAASPVAYLKSYPRGILALGFALPRVNHQIRNEFLPILYLRSHIMAKVSRFNFSHVVTFLNSLFSADLGTLLAPSPYTHPIGEEKRGMVIQLTMNYTWMPRMERYMRRWLNRIEDPTKMGSGIDIQYLADPEERGWWHWWAKHFRRVSWEGGQAGLSVRKRDELRKIFGAFELEDEDEY